MPLIPILDLDLDPKLNVKTNAQNRVQKLTTIRKLLVQNLELFLLLLFLVPNLDLLLLESKFNLFPKGLVSSGEGEEAKFT